MADNRTTNLGLKLPDPTNSLDVDVLRIIDSFQTLDAAIPGKQSTSEKGAANGYASLDDAGKVPVAQIPSLSYIPTSQKGAASGVASLGDDGKVPSAQLPSYVDDVLEYADFASFPASGDTGKIYVALDTNKIYRWSGSAYIEISPTAGNADTATKLATARTIAGVSFDGSANIDIPFANLTSKPTTLSGYGITDSLALGTATPLVAGTAAVGTATTAAKADHVHPAQTSVSGNAGTATKLATARTIAGVSFDGSSNIDIPFSGLTSKPTTLSGYGITDSLQLGSTAGAALGTAAAGTATTAARSDHVHAAPTSVSGNAGTATKLATARTINGVSFDGSANITINAVDSTARIASSEKGAASGVASLGSDGKVPASQLPSYVDDVLEYANLAGFPVSGESAKIYVALDTNKIYRWSGTGYIEISPTAGNADTATKLATARTIAGVSFDGSANIDIPFSGLTSKPTTLAGYGITDALTLGSTAGAALGTAAAGTATTAARSDHVHAAPTTVSGNAGTATKLATGRTISLSGDVTYTSPAFDGSGNVTAAATLANSGVVAGTYKSVTVDAKGRVTAGTNPTTLSGYGITDAASSSHTHSSLVNGTGTATLDASGNFTASGNVTAYSDERFKTNWRNMGEGFVSRLAGVLCGVYDRVDTGETQVGVSAQSLREVMPEAVLENADGFLSVAYGNAALAACVALAREVVALRAEVEALKAGK